MWNNIIGQSAVLESIKNSIESNSVAHAYIFEGPGGIGKMTVAKAVAGALVCQGDVPPCGVCKTCLLSKSQNHPDVKIISGESSISVESIRDMVKDAGIRPYYDRKKVYIIEDAEKMTIQAQNSLLKTLEEPPEYVVIILTTASASQLLPTIISRCIVKKFVRNTDVEIEQYIKSHYPNRMEDSKLYIAMSEGIIGNLKNLIESEEFNEIRQKTLGMVNKLASSSRFESLEMSKFFGDNKENVDLVLHLMLLWFRDILIMKETNNENFVVNRDMVSKIVGASRVMDADKINRSIDAVLEAKSNLSSNANFALTIEVMLLKLV